MIKTLYQKQCKRPLPFIHDLDFSDLNKLKICPFLTDVEIAGAISSYLHAIDRNSPIKMDIFHNLEKSRNDLEGILKVINQDAYEYFYNWYILCNLILNEISPNN